MHLVPGFSDIQVGSYLFMDMQYLAIGSETGEEIYSDFAPSLTITTTIVNNRFPGLMTTDAGTKALTLNKPNAAVIGEPGMDHTAGSDEFGTIRYKDATKAYKIGDKLELIAPHCDPVVNLYDQIYGSQRSRGGRVAHHGAREFAVKRRRTEESDLKKRSNEENGVLGARC